jgi:S1-C subfamily serine protease
MQPISRVFAGVLFLSIVTVASGQVSQTTNKLEATSLYERAAPSVVVITSVDAAGQTSQGSGVVLRADGVIATNLHVIADAVSARIQLANGDVYDDVSVLDTDERRDIAILRVKAINLPALAVADSDTVKIGATVYVIGAPRGLTGSLSSGIVSSLRSASEVSPTLTGFRVIQFTAPISPGSSGGPLFDESGKLLGLVFASRVDGQNINLAIPVNYVAPLVANAKNEGRALKRMPNLESSKYKSGTIDDIAGTYTGEWRSDKYSDAYGNVVLTISVVNGQVQAQVVLTGSTLFKQDTLIARVTPRGAAWQMDYKSKNGKIDGTGLFRGGTFVGDYSFHKFLWFDSGKWRLER